MDKTRNKRLSDWLPECDILRDGVFDCLDEASAINSNSLVYCQTIHFFDQALKNNNVTSIIIPVELSELSLERSSFREVGIAAINDPRRAFFKLYAQINHLDNASLELESTGIGNQCNIHKTAIIDPNSYIGNNVTISANVVIESHSIIEDDVYIAPNVVIGAEGLMTVRNDDGSLLIVQHSGGVLIERGCQLLAGVVIAKSMFQQFTSIGKYTQLGIMSNIGHGAVIGESCVISGNSVVAGRTRLGNNVWVGASSSIAQGLKIGAGAQIKMGSVVVGNVKENEAVSGNFAVNHRLNMKRFLKVEDNV